VAVLGALKSFDLTNWPAAMQRLLSFAAYLPVRVSYDVEK